MGQNESYSAREWVSPRQFAAIVGISTESVYRLLARRQLEGVKFGRAWRLPLAQLEA